MTLALAIVASLGLAVQAVPGTVEGVVRAAADGSPIRGAEIVLVGSGHAAVTDARGHYTLVGVPGGERRLLARRMGFDPIEIDISVPPDGMIAVDFHLRLAPHRLPPVGVSVTRTVSASQAPYPVSDRQRPPPRAVIRALDASPGVAELGLSAGARALLGPDPPAPDNVLYVRGAGAALDLVLLDGAPVHAPFHLGGLLDPGLPPAIVRARRLQGGVTSRYDGGLADVLLLESRPAAAGTQATLFVDMLAVGGAFETADPEIGAVSVSYRSLHGAGEGGLVQSGFPQGYVDALLRSDLYMGADSLSLTLFHNNETVRLGEASPRDEPRWGNTAGSLRYHSPTPLGRMELGAGIGSFDTRLPVGSSDPLIASGSTLRARAWADFRQRIGDTGLGYGIQGSRLSLRTKFREPADADTPVRLKQSAGAGRLGVWLEGARTMLPGLALRVGLRADVFSNGLGSSLAPRLALGWQVEDDLRLTGSFGQFHQLVVGVDTEFPVESSAVASPDGGLLGSIRSRVEAARATHVVLGLTHAPRASTMVRVEAFWKTLRGVPEFGNGSLRNAGFDVVVSRPITPTFKIWGAYTLGWAWADYPDAASQTVYTARHFLRGGVTFEAPGKLRLDADLSMGEGLEFGAIPRSERIALTPADPAGAPAPGASARAATPPSAPGAAVRVQRSAMSVRGPLDAGGPIFTRVPNGSYLRLNVQATAEFDIEVFGHDQQLRPYFRIINALDRRDALFFQFDGDENDEPRPIGSVPILPVVGLEWRL